ncbi:MAG: glycoside hydrolase family 99-like domain-containing protein [Candidatus Levybacteria bacterium]|nr:glycoside hydrolase family 99-like domain-containing protein [Candidatus Levybacteria bacterium]
MKRLTFIYLLALVIRFIFAAPMIHDWDGFVFTESAKNFIQGETPYQTVIKNDPVIYPDSEKPMIQQWYAYPPLPLLMFSAPLALVSFFNINIPPIFETLLIKIPFIFGDLIAALIVRKFLEKKDKKLAQRAELLILFNPLLIWVSSAWGMFDIWMANFLLLYIMALRKSRTVLGGVFLGLACTIKLFPVFFLPVIAIYSFNKIKALRARVTLLVTFLTTLLVVSVPFFLTSPRGFINQNLLMHLQRPPQGLSIAPLYEYYQYLYHLPSLPIATICTILMYLTILAVSVRGIVSIKTKEESLIWSLVSIYMAILLFNKVVNEQYFVLLIVFLTILIYTPITIYIHFPYKILHITKAIVTYSVLIAATILGFHFLSFLLPEVVLKEMSSSINQLVFDLSRHFNLPIYTYPDTVLTFYNIPVLIATILMLPVYAMGLIILGITWKQVFQDFGRIITQLGSIFKTLFKRLYLVAFLVLLTFGAIVGFVIHEPVGRYIAENKLFMPITLLDATDLKPLPKNPRIGTFYNVWWNNFSHYKSFPYGAWDKTTLTPLGGYYTSKNSYYVEHIRQMKEVGIDFAIIPYHLYDRQRYLTFGYYAQKMGLYYSPMIEIGDVLNYDNFRPLLSNGKRSLGFALTEESEKEMKSIIVSSISDNNKDKALLRIDGKPVIFLYDSHWYFPSWDTQSKDDLTKTIIAMYAKKSSKPFEEISSAWGVQIASREDMLKYYPTETIAFHDDTQTARDYREAFLLEYKEYWASVRKYVEDKVGPVYLVSSYTSKRPDEREFAIIADDFSDMAVFDAQFTYSPSNTWTSYRDQSLKKKLSIWSDQVEAQKERSEQAKSPLFLPVMKQYDDTKVRQSLGFVIPEKIGTRSVYEATWQTAIENKADYTLITSWNEFFEGTAIEPSVEKGTSYLDETKKWIKIYKDSLEEDGK